MAFLGEVILTVIKMVIVGIFAFCGLMLGRYLRRRKEEKKVDTIEK